MRLSFSLKTWQYSMLLERPAVVGHLEAACWALLDHEALSALKIQAVILAASVPCALDWHWRPQRSPSCQQ
eukprot:1300928-Pyramimonas_sp.AAC.1